MFLQEKYTFQNHPKVKVAGLLNGFLECIEYHGSICFLNCFLFEKILI
jgi:hypothetical protein